MSRWLIPFRNWSEERKANSLAGMVAVGALAVLYFEASPVPAGSGSHRIAAVRSRALVLQSAPTAGSQVMASIPATAAATSSSRDVTAATGESPSMTTLRTKVALLEKGKTFLKATPDYTAVFSKQELVGSELLDCQEIYLKCRHEPLSLYLRWLSGDEGREVLYVDGTNGGEMVVHGGGWKARLPSLSISPDSSLAMQESRYPVTKAGLLGTVEIMLGVHAEDLAGDRIARCEQLADEEFDGRMCSAFLIEYRDSRTSPVYRKSITLIDKEWNVPLYTRNFGWPSDGESATGEELDEATLIEFYTFTEVQFRQQLAAADFDRSNEEYLFR